jgi:thiol-disulfide isomerase/thioredoxin
MRTRLTAASVTALLLLAGCGSSTDATGSGADSGFVAGDGSIVVVPASQRVPAPDLSGETLDGTTYRLRDHLGEVVVLNVWASWCAPCRAEAPTLASLATELDGSGVQFVGLDTRDSDVSARAFADRFGIRYPNVIDRDGRLQLLFGDSLPPQAIPSTLVVDREGRVAARALGKVSESSLRGMIEPLLAAATPSAQPSAAASAGSGA